MKGRALQLYEDFRRGAAASANPFGVCRVILLARIVPEQLTPELDDASLEERLENAIRHVNSSRAERR